MRFEIQRFSSWRSITRIWVERGINLSCVDFIRYLFVTFFFSGVQAFSIIMRSGLTKLEDFPQLYCLVWSLSHCCFGGGWGLLICNCKLGINVCNFFFQRNFHIYEFIKGLINYMCEQKFVFLDKLFFLSNKSEDLN